MFFIFRFSFRYYLLRFSYQFSLTNTLLFRQSSLTIFVFVNENCTGRYVLLAINAITYLLTYLQLTGYHCSYCVCFFASCFVLVLLGLPPQRDSTITSRLRSAAIYPRPATRTKRFTSSVQYFLLNYQ